MKYKLPIAISLALHVMILAAPQVIDPSLELAASEPQHTTVTLVNRVKPQPKVVDVSEPSPAEKEVAEPISTDKPVQESVASIESDQINPTAIRNVAPHYPKFAQRKGFEGMALLRVEVLPSGETGEVTLIQSTGYSVLDQEAKAALERWLFSPATKQGKAISSWIEVPITFELSNRLATI